MSSSDRRRSNAPIRLTLASTLGDDLDGAWWPYSPSIARELPELIEALRKPLGDVIDIAVSWSALEGVPDLDSLSRRGIDGVPGLQARDQRVMTVTGDRARANLLVVPCRTSNALAVMVMRQAATLPIMASHLDTPAYRHADDIVGAARAESARRTRLAISST